MNSPLTLKGLMIFVGPRSILWVHWYHLSWTSYDSAAHGFHSHGGFIIASTLCRLHQSRIKKFVRGGPNDSQNLWPTVAAIFFLTSFNRVRGAGPPGPPWIHYCTHNDPQSQSYEQVFSLQ